MTSKEYSRRFEQLYRLFSEAYLVFYVWKGLQDKAFEKTFSENPGFWNATLFSLENCWLTGLARIYENSRFSQSSKVISVFALLPHQTDMARATKVRSMLKGNTRIIENIQKLRHNQLAHNNAKHLLKPKVLLNKFPIKYREAEKLLTLSGEILSNLHPKTGRGYAYKMLAEGSENESKHVVKKLQYYSKLHDEHWEKFKRGEVSDLRFPL